MKFGYEHEIDSLRSRVAELEAERDRLPSIVTITCPKCGFQSKSDFTKWEEDEHDRSHSWALDDRLATAHGHIKQLRARIAELEASLENSRSLAWERASRIAALEAERDRLKNALEQIQNGEAIGGLYGHATEIARVALAGAKPC